MIETGLVLSGGLALTVHGPAGVVDLVVPLDAEANDVAREYALQCRLRTVPPLVTRIGERLHPRDRLASRGVVSGDLLVTADVVEAGHLDTPAAPKPPSEGGWLMPVVAVAGAGLAGWLGAHLTGMRHDLVAVVLGIATLAALVPAGGRIAARAVAAPAFAWAAAFVVAWDPEPARLPTVLGVASLVAAVVAALARSIDRRADEALRVWIVAGLLVFVTAFAVAFGGWRPQVVWAVLVLAAGLAARLVPSYAVDVPDSYLLEIDRLAVHAWSARERPRGRRARSVVPLGAVRDVAAQGARTLTASAAAILAVTVPAAPLLLSAARLPVDDLGARLLVGLVGVGLLLAARSYRYDAPKALLRLAGLWCLGAVVVVMLHAWSGWISTLAIVIGLGVVAAAVATGRGWRSARVTSWADLAETAASVLAVASLVVATGAFRVLWESGLGV